MFKNHESTENYLTLIYVIILKFNAQINSVFIVVPTD